MYQQIPPSSIELGMNHLESLKWPDGLKIQMTKNWEKFPYRFMVLDDSGSMGISDGNMLVKSGNLCKEVRCTRWEEMGDTVKFHAELADIAKAPTEFCFLNSAAPIVVGEQEDDGQAKNKLLTILSDSPSGGTPLCRVLNQIHTKVKKMEPELLNRGQKVSITIFTDGQASDGDLARVLNKFAHMPVWCVVRLCTNEDAVNDYWSGIDDNIELQMDVLDDIKGEALEVTRLNPWLTYGPALHLLRESGCHVKELDRLDESRLQPGEIHRVVPIVLGGKPDDLVHPELDVAQFKASIETATNRNPETWDPVSKCFQPWIKVNKIAGGGGGCCIIA